MSVEELKIGRIDNIVENYSETLAMLRGLKLVNCNFENTIFDFTPFHHLNQVHFTCNQSAYSVKQLLKQAVKVSVANITFHL